MNEMIHIEAHHFYHIEKSPKREWVLYFKLNKTWNVYDVYLFNVLLVMLLLFTSPPENPPAPSS